MPAGLESASGSPHSAGAYTATVLDGAYTCSGCKGLGFRV